MKSMERVYSFMVFEFMGTNLAQSVGNGCSRIVLISDVFIRSKFIVNCKWSGKMKKVLFILFFPIQITFCQWQVMTKGLPGAIIEFDFGTRGEVYSTTYGYSTYKSTFPYNIWTPVFSQLPIAGNQPIYIFREDYCLCVTNSNGEIYRSTDYGATWNLIGSGIYSSFADDILAVDSLVFISQEGTGVLVSEDYGLTWNYCNAGLLSNTFTYQFAYDNGNIYMGTIGGVSRYNRKTSNWTNLVNIAWAVSVSAKNGIIIANSFNPSYGTSNGVYRSTDNGNSWTSINNGLPSLGVNRVLCLGSTMFAGTTSGMCISEDAGDNWVLVNDGIPLYSLDRRMGSILSKDNLIYAVCTPAVYIQSLNTLKRNYPLSISFPNVGIGDSLTKSIYIYNSSLDTMRINSVTTSSSAFTSSTDSLILTGFDSTMIRITFKPTTYETFYDTVFERSNVDTTIIIVSGNSPLPMLIPVMASMTFNNVAKNTVMNSALKIVNSSANKLIIDSTYTKTSAFTVGKISGSVGTDTLSVIVSFAPVELGSYMDTMYLKNNSATPLVKIPLSGTSPGPVISSTLNLLNFVNKAVGDSAIMMVFLKDISVNQMSISTITTGTSIFTAVVGAQTVNGQDSTILSVKFKPTSLGIFTDTAKVVSDGGTVKIALSGNSPQPTLTSLKSNIAYGNVAKNATKSDTIIVVNSSINPLIIDSIYTKSSAFVADRNSGTVRTDSLKIAVSFTPATIGSYADTVYLRNNSTTPLVKIPLSGLAPIPVLTVSDTMLQFVDKASGDSVSRIVGIFNKSISSLTVNSIAFGTSAFVIDTASVNPSTAVALGKKMLKILAINERKPKIVSKNNSTREAKIASFILPTVVIDTLNFRVWFKPVGFGSFTDTLSIVSDGGSKKIPVSGNSPYPNLVCSATQIDFGAVGVYDSAKTTINFTNTSVNALVIDTAYASTSSFSTSLNKTSINVGDTVYATVNFSMIRFGNFADTLVIKDNAAMSTFRIPLKAFTPPASIVVNRQKLSFGNVTNDTLSQLVISIADTSISRLAVDSLLTETKYFEVFKTLVNKFLKKGDTATTSIRFHPDTLKAYSDTLYIYNSSPVSPFKIPLTGNGVLTSVMQTAGLVPDHYFISQNYPNPFNPSTMIEYGLPAKSSVRVRIYNILGQRVATLYDGMQSAGYQKVQWNARVSSGIYFYRFEATSVDGSIKQFIETKKMLLLK